MTSAPRDSIDGTLSLLREGYEFIWNRCRRLQSDIFVTRLMGKRTVCIHGRDAAALFYDESKLERHGAIPRRVETSLFGKRTVQTLDGAAHRVRKAAMLSVMTPASIERLVDRTAHDFRRAIRRWELDGRIMLFDEVPRVFTRAVCAWAGVPLDEAKVASRARDFVSMVDGFGGVGPRLLRAKLARARTERWIEGVVTRVRRDTLEADPSSALYAMAHLRDEHDRPVPVDVAARELVDLLRPTVAISWYVTFAALALHEHPRARERLLHEGYGGGAGAGAYADLFMQEVRRFYPFTPFLGAKARQTFEWRGHRFEKGTLVLLDVYGNDRDPRWWDEPDEFRPERFEGLRLGPFDFIPQGGGDHAKTHRCAGEWITMHQIALALHFLTRCMTYDVAPGQDLSFDRSRIPTRPKSGLVLQNVRATAALDGAAPRVPSRFAAEGNAAALADGSIQPIEPPASSRRFVPRAHPRVAWRS